MDSDGLLVYIKQLKDAEQTLQAKKVCSYGLENFKDENFVRVLMPMLISLHRQTSAPQEAIDTANKFLKIYGKNIASAALYTSMAAAYCDLGNYACAKNYADRAYAVQGGGQGYANELTLVYRRIRSESGGAFADID